MKSYFSLFNFSNIFSSISQIWIYASSFRLPVFFSNSHTHLSQSFRAVFFFSLSVSSPCFWFCRLFLFSRVFSSSFFCYAIKFSLIFTILFFLSSASVLFLACTCSSLIWISRMRSAWYQSSFFHCFLRDSFAPSTFRCFLTDSSSFHLKIEFWFFCCLICHYSGLIFIFTQCTSLFFYCCVFLLSFSTFSNNIFIDFTLPASASACSSISAQFSLSQAFFCR